MKKKLAFFVCLVVISINAFAQEVSSVTFFNLLKETAELFRYSALQIEMYTPDARLRSIDENGDGFCYAVDNSSDFLGRTVRFVVINVNTGQCIDLLITGDSNIWEKLESADPSGEHLYDSRKAGMHERFKRDYDSALVSTGLKKYFFNHCRV
jgi:hypothetical protein